MLTDPNHAAVTPSASHRKQLRARRPLPRASNASRTQRRPISPRSVRPKKGGSFAHCTGEQPRTRSCAHAVPDGPSVNWLTLALAADVDVEPRVRTPHPLQASPTSATPSHSPNDVAHHAKLPSAHSTTWSSSAKSAERGRQAITWAHGRRSPASTALAALPPAPGGASRLTVPPDQRGAPRGRRGWSRCSRPRRART